MSGIIMLVYAVMIMIMSVHQLERNTATGFLAKWESLMAMTSTWCCTMMGTRSGLI